MPKQAMPGLRRKRGREAHDLAQPAPHAIALDRIPDLLRHREAEPGRCRVVARECLQDEGAGRYFHACGGGKKIRSLRQPLHRIWQGRQALSRLRPFERRAAITLRPPVVAVRARKP